MFAWGSMFHSCRECGKHIGREHDFCVEHRGNHL